MTTLYKDLIENKINELSLATDKIMERLSKSTARLEDTHSTFHQLDVNNQIGNVLIDILREADKVNSLENNCEIKDIDDLNVASKVIKHIKARKPLTCNTFENNLLCRALLGYTIATLIDKYHHEAAKCSSYLIEEIGKEVIEVEEKSLKGIDEIMSLMAESCSAEIKYRDAYVEFYFSSLESEMECQYIRIFI